MLVRLTQVNSFGTGKKVPVLLEAVRVPLMRKVTDVLPNHWAYITPEISIFEIILGHCTVFLE